MQLILKENTNIGKLVQSFVRLANSDTYTVEKHPTLITVFGEAYYNDDHSVFVSDVRCSLPLKLPPHRKLETIPTFAEAVRAAVAHVDWYTQQINELIADINGDSRDDDEVIASYLAGNYHALSNTPPEPGA